MKITHLQDPAQIYKKLATDLWEAIETTLDAETVSTDPILCLKPEACTESPEVVKRKWMALITVSSIINIRVNIGSETLSDVVASLDYCNCE